ncbi:MAG: hypothetical protein MUO76_05630 [Anaerolineaceae bacterium]|nr:hypothetical protein [Anaerolineaceae bacterium]
MIGPTAVGIATGALVGTINDNDAGLLWFYRHGVSYIIAFLFLIGYLQAVKVRKALD